MSPLDVHEAVAQAHREEWARTVATLARRFGDLDLAEEAAAEAFATAVRGGPNPFSGAHDLSIMSLVLRAQTMALPLSLRERVGVKGRGTAPRLAQAAGHPAP